MANYLSWQVMNGFRRVVVQEQQRIQRSREDIAPFILATWSSWFSLDAFPQMRMQGKFPVTSNWLRLMQQDATELVGDCVLLQSHVPGPALTTDQLSVATTCRSTIFEELDFLPTHIEEKIDAMPTVLRPVVEKYLNAIAELFQEAAQITEDPLLFRIATRMSEACVRSRMRVPEDSNIVRGMTVVDPPDAVSGPSRADDGSSSDESLEDVDAIAADGVGHQPATRD